MTFFLFRLSFFILKPLCAFIFLQGSFPCVSWNSQALVQRRNTEISTPLEKRGSYLETHPNYKHFTRGRLKSNETPGPIGGSNSLFLVEKLFNSTNLNLKAVESNLENSNAPFTQRTKWRDRYSTFYKSFNQNGHRRKDPDGESRSLPLVGSNSIPVFPSPSLRNTPQFILPDIPSGSGSPKIDGRTATPGSSPSNPGVASKSPRDPARDFYHHRVFTPRLYHARTKREILSTFREEEGNDYPHHPHVSLGLTIGDQNELVDLQLNRDLLPKGYFEKRLTGDSQDIRRPQPSDAGMCHYLGVIRDRPGSWAALSTCNGIRGVVFDGSELHYIEPMTDRPENISISHYSFNHKDLIPHNMTCGYSGKPHPPRDLFKDEHFSRLLRYRRDTSRETIRGPYNANVLSRYVELILVTDVAEYDKYDKDEKKIFQRCKDIANIVNALYQPLNIFIALVGVEVWKEKDQVNISTDGDKTLTKFLNYRKFRLIPKHPNDNAQLLTGKVFDSGVVGKALKGPICTYQYSGGVNMDHSESVGLVATTVAHEMGHNFGMEHDTEEECECPDKRCIMSPSSGTKSPTHWSSCSHEYLAISFERSMDYCLRNKPTSLFNSPVCGNGFVEPGEQCDCGLPDYCTNTCCNATACMLFPNATCATGHCCDLQTCRPKDAGVECRQALHECDLPEFCSGDSEFCPANFYKEDGHECLSGKAYCYEGMCRTHEHQCRLLWGPTGKNSNDKCYQLNKEGDSNGNCGYNWATETYMKCNYSDIKCGMMHCKHFNERLEFGMESVSKVSHRFITDKGGVIPCRVAQVDLGLDMVDPGLAPDGAKCGYNKMCVNQHCIEVASLRLTKCDCNGNGVCNNKGNCHCDVGFTYPDCIYPGLGGSKDSGPASNPNAINGFIIAMFIFFLGIVPIVVILLLTYYVKGNLKLWWLRKGIPATSRLSGKDSGGITGSIAPGLGEVSKTSQTKGSNKGTSPSPPSSQGSKSNSPLLNGYANGPTKKAFSDDFFGKQEGFTLSPLKNKPKTRGESEPPSSPPALAKTDQQSRTQSFLTSLSPSGENKTAIWKVKPNSLPINAWPPVPNGGKVEISQPSLQASTNPSVEAPSHQAVLRPAPPPPSQGTISADSLNRRSITRPKSVPDATTLIVQQKSASLDCDSSLTSPDSSLKEGKQSAVARIASFLSKKDKVDVPETTQVGQSNTLPRKAAKINRESLLQLEISHPMQLQATELPSNLVPVRTAPDPPMPSNIKPSDVKAAKGVILSPDKNVSTKVSWAPDVLNSKIKDEDTTKPDILRIGSVREQSVTSRPAIPKFGSMRTPRPKSLPPPTRPSQPPPRPPLPMIPGTPESEHFYDESFDSGTSAPLAHSEDYPSPQESIYATIEDDIPESLSPVETIPNVDVVTPKKEKKSIFSFIYSKSKKKSESPKEKNEPLYCNVDVESSDSKSSPTSKSQRSSIDRTSSGSIECGLLSEIVSELANREPQYVNTLSKKKRSLSEEKPESKKGKSEAQNRSLHSSPTKDASSLKAPVKKSISPAEPSSQDAKVIERVPPPSSSSAPSYLSSAANPRGVFSYLQKSHSQESSKNSSNPQPSLAKSAKHSPEESTIQSSAKILGETTPAKNKASIPDTHVSSSKSLGAVSTATKEAPPLRKSNTNLKIKKDTEAASKSSTKLNSPSASTAIPVVSNSNPPTTAPTTSTSRGRPYFPPDKMISSKQPKYAQANSAAKKTEGKTPSSGRPITPGSSSGLSKSGRVTSPPRVPSQLQAKAASNTSAQNAQPTGPPEKPKGALAPKPSNLKTSKRVSSAPSKPEIKSKFPPDKSIEKDVKDAGKSANPQTTRPTRAASAPLKSPTTSKNGVFTSAAKGSSHVASLQQKFEAESGQSAKQPPAKGVKKSQDRPSVSAKPK